MGLQKVVAAPFKQHGTTRLEESKFVVGVSLDRDWFSPDQAGRITELGIREGLLQREENDLIAQFNPESVVIPSGFEPGDDYLVDRSPFETVVTELLDEGMDKQSSVAQINQLQVDLGISADAAAVVFARQQNIDLTNAVQSLFEGSGSP